MWKVLCAFAVGLAVAVAVFLRFALYTWTAIHSGWSDVGLQIFATAMRAVPPVLGLIAGWVAYRVTGGKGRR